MNKQKFRNNIIKYSVDVIRIKTYGIFASLSNIIAPLIQNAIIYMNVTSYCKL